jgi:DNA end-binding protein Ku
MLSPDGAPLERHYVCPEEGRSLEPDEIVRGYEVSEGEFVRIEDEELEALAPRRSRDIEIVRFVERDAIDPAFFERAWFMVPAGEQSKAYRVLAEALESSGRAAIARFVMRDRPHGVAVFADGGVLRAEALRFSDELRSASQAGLPGSAKPQASRVRKMRAAIEARASDALEEAELRDPESERLLALARRKLERQEDVIDLPEPDSRAAESAGEVIDLVALLKRQLHERRARPKRRTTPRRKAQRSS